MTAQGNVTQEAFDEEPEPFKFIEPGDRLVGELVTVIIVKSSYGPNKYPHVEVRDEAGKLWDYHASQSALVNAWKRVKPQPGEHISILFKGMGISQTGREYKNFSLRVARDVREVDYDELESDDDDDTL
jgi:hypothetical protein